MSKEKLTPPVRPVPNAGGVKQGHSTLTTPTQDGTAQGWTRKTKPAGNIMGKA